MAHSGTTHETSLLLTLEEISQLVSHCHDPGETLANIVGLIQGRFHTDVCSVYLLEPERGELVLAATIGLDPTSIGRVRMRLDEGLTGLVAERLAPVIVDDAFQHPRFKYFSESGEDPYHSFLGVPLVEAGGLQGVLVVQTGEPRRFSADEARMLVTVGSQLAPLVSGARLLERIAAAGEPETLALLTARPAGPVSLRGTPLSAGVGLGQAYVINGFGGWQPSAETTTVDPIAEAQRLALAMEAAREEITRLSRRISELVGEDHGAILQAQLMILQDRTIEQGLSDCLAAGDTAEKALGHLLDRYVAAFRKLSNPFFRERVFDIKDVFRRVHWHLQPHPPAADDASGRLVLVAHEASVLDLFSVELDRLAALVVEHGGPQSHAAILARSLGVPMVGQVSGLVDAIRPGQFVLVDGVAGRIDLDPPPEALGAGGASAASPPVATLTVRIPPDPCAVPNRPRIEANINLYHEVIRAADRGADGVGLFRTEYLFLARRTLPTEEEQVGLYRKLLDHLGGRPASIRTFDLRPDKLAHCSHLASPSALAFDWRQVLDSPPIQKLFKEQVRAILRASTAGPARLLVPFVTQTEQLDFIVEAVGQARLELQREGLEFDDGVPLGIMIEVAAAAAMVETWADRVDFFTLGTNDLMASALGINRDDPVTSRQDDPLHPGLLRLIHESVAAAHRAGRPITVCGEMASDPAGALALVTLGVDALSVAVERLDATRRVLLERSPAELATLVPQLIRLRTADQVRDLLDLDRRSMTRRITDHVSGLA